jgi:hypothetical protein
MLKYPWVARLADDLSDSMVIAASASQELRHGSVSGTLGWSELARARCAGQGDFLFAYGGVAVANMDHANVCGRSTANPARIGSLLDQNCVLTLDVLVQHTYQRGDAKRKQCKT